MPSPTHTHMHKPWPKIILLLHFLPEGSVLTLTFFIYTQTHHVSTSINMCQVPCAHAMLMAVHILVVKLDANQRIITMIKPHAACISVCVMYVFTEHECVSMSLEMAVRASGTPSCQLPLFSTTHTPKHLQARLQLQSTVTVVR